ncbi:MAG: MFS transporter [Roseibium sp.]|uniref:MFS transporter n=1 Tax=Roseibium sp. TaxID=1936156 RepID=UPI0026092C24|nr:MFS transporter [Roseibium sp.]MCV0426096.1 MFS transporter [Roseibium sp.]
MSTVENHQSPDRPTTRLATRLVFFVAGFVLGCWSPLIPFVKQRLALDEAGLGLLLLCLGIGSVLTMPLAGIACTRFGTRKVIVWGGIGLTVIFPVVAITASVWATVAIVLLIGVFLGLLEVGMNSHAVEVERGSTKPLMSGFHALFSVGGFAGAGGAILLLTVGVTPFLTAFLSAATGLAIISVAWPFLLKNEKETESGALVFPKGIVLVIALMTAITFLVEGAILDWGALLVTGQGLVEISMGGFGYMLFSVAMTIGRLFGDRFVAAIGSRQSLVWGGAVTIAGVLLITTAPHVWVSGAGFVAIGFGASNIVPVLFSLAGAQRAMPHGQAVAAVATAGYGGILLGPAAIGFVAEVSSLPAAFFLLALLMSIIPIFAFRATAAIAKPC